MYLRDTLHATLHCYTLHCISATRYTVPLLHATLYQCYTLHCTTATHYTVSVLHATLYQCYTLHCISATHYTVSVLHATLQQPVLHVIAPVHVVSRLAVLVRVSHSSNQEWATVAWEEVVHE